METARGTRAVGRTLLGGQVVAAGERIAALVKGSRLLDDMYTLQFRTLSERVGEIYGIFEIVDDATAAPLAESSVVIYTASDGVDAGRVIISGRGVDSTLGNRTGHFLILLQILLGILLGTVSDVAEFVLENYTDDPARAARPGGIYGLLQVEQRESLTGTSRSDFAGATLTDALLLSQGQMRLRFGGDTFSRWMDDSKVLAAKLDTSHRAGNTIVPWNPVPSVSANMATFIAALGQHYSGPGPTTPRRAPFTPRRAPASARKTPLRDTVSKKGLPSLKFGGRGGKKSKKRRSRAVRTKKRRKGYTKKSRKGSK